jgi:hypothetical protein
MGDLIVVLVIFAALAAGVVLAWRLGAQSRRRDVLVRCRDGHVFTTAWIPDTLALIRLQYCPVGAHWTTVTAVRR